jgi:hypothetical protein
MIDSHGGGWSREGGKFRNFEELVNINPIKLPLKEFFQNPMTHFY